MDEKKKKDDGMEEKKHPRPDKKGNRYEIDRGKEPHKHQHSPDEEEDQTR